MKSFSLGTTQGCPHSGLLFNIKSEVLVRAVRQDKELKGTHIGKEEVNLLQFAVDMILYKENPRLKQKTVGTNQRFQKSCRIYHQQYRNQVIFLYTINKTSDGKK